MVALDALRYVNDIDPIVVPQEIIFRQIAVDEATALEHVSHDAHCLDIGLAHSFFGERCIFEPGRRPSVGAEEFHDEYVRFEKYGFGTGDSCTVEAAVVSHFFLSPDFYHFARVGFTFLCPWVMGRITQDEKNG